MSFTNVYHLNNYVSSNLSITGVILKTNEIIKTTNFVNELNYNKNNINLSSIDSSLSGYALCNWKLGSDNYPTLNC